MLKTLKSSVFKLKQEEIDFLTKVPEGGNKSQTEVDIHRTGGLFINRSPIYDEGKKIDGRDNLKFEEAQKAFQKKFTDSGVNQEEANYFSHLMTHLCTQTFYTVPWGTAMFTDPENFSASINASGFGHFYQLKLITENGKPSHLDSEFTLHIGDNKYEYAGTRTIKYSFFADKTMQVSMDNPNDKCHEFFKTFFTKLLCVDKKTFLIEKPEHHVAYNVLSSDIGLFIESMSFTKDYNSTTLARLIEEGLRSGKIEGNLSEGIYDRLSDQAKAKIDEIAKELERRNQANGFVDEVILTIKDWINIAVNFFATIFGYGVNNQEFKEFTEAMFKSEDQKGASINTFAAQIEAARTNKSPRIPEVVF